MRHALVRGLVTVLALFVLTGLATSTAEASVSPAPHPRSAAAAAAVSVTTAVPVARHHRVHPGDSLSLIARRAWHHASWWPRLWYANQAAVRNPDMIAAGQRLRVPPGKAPRPYMVRAALRAVPPPPAPAAPVRHRHHRFRAAAAAAAPAPQSGGGVYSFGALESLWVSAGGPVWAEAAAATIAECESGGNPHAYNPSGASGLWQILGQVVGGYIFDPMVNALNAVSKFRASGDTFAQWVCQA